MSGSGATCFALFSEDAKAHAASEQIRRDHSDWWVHAGVLS
jgi:4-diphosphocytidyl-2-C-methyl-D-erythritol kinase